MADPTNPPPRPPGPWDHEDPPDIRPGAIPKKPKKPDLTPGPVKDGDPKDVTLGWLDESAHPNYLKEVIVRAVKFPRDDSMVVVEASAAWKGILSVAYDTEYPQDESMPLEASRGDWKGIISAAFDGAPIPPGHDDCDPHDDGEPCHACIAEEE